MSRFSVFRGEARTTLALAFPIMAGQLSQMMMGLLDSAMVGHVGVLPLAASAFANSVLSIPFVFGIGLLTCLSVRASQSHGAGDHEQSGEVLRHGLALAGGMGLLLTGLVWITSHFLNRLGQSPDVALAARSFFLIIGVSMIPALLAMALKVWCEAIGNPWPPMLILLGAVPINAFLNWILIYGNWGAPALGLDGAGYATLISRCIALIAMASYVVRAPQLRLHLPLRWREFRRKEFVSQLRVGIPAGFHVCLEVAAFAAGALLAGRLGKESLAAHQIALSCSSTIFMLPLGISIATTIRIGNALGSGDLQRVRSIGGTSLILSLVVMSTAAIGLWAGGDVIASHFVQDRAVILIASQLLIITAIFQLFDGIQVVSAGALRGLSDATVPMVYCFVAYWLIGLPLGSYAAFSLGWGAAGIWSGFALGLCLTAILLTWRFSIKSKPYQLRDRRCIEAETMV